MHVVHVATRDSPEKTVLFNKQMIIIMLIERRKKSLFTILELNGSSFEQT